MPTVRAAALLIAVIALGGCASQLAATPPAGTSLAGNWKIDPAASDDPQKALAQMRAEALKIMSRRASMPPPPANPNSRGGAAARVPDDSMPPQLMGPGIDPLRHSPMAHIVLDFIARGEFLTIRQAPGEIVLDFGTSVRRYRPGAKSVVSAEGGVGDQVSGWKSNAYVIEIKAQSGPAVTESFSLTDDGHGLIDKLHIASDELSAVNLTRVYRRSTEQAPRATPNAD